MSDSIDSTLEERGERYGKFVGHAWVSQHLKATIHSRLRSREVVVDNDQAEAIDMICHKLGRIANGDPNYADSWRDIAGYAMLVAHRLEGVEK